MSESIIKANFDETRQSQLPFVELLINLGWEFLPSEELELAREHRQDKHILKNICFECLNKINSFEFGGKVHKFSPKNIVNAINDLETIQFQGLVTTSASVYADLVAGRDLREFINGKDESFNFAYIDFKNIENNLFQVAVEVSAKGSERMRADIVLYVNGIPLVVIENKRSAIPVNEAIIQLLDYQKNKAPRFFLYPQLLIATNKVEFLYGTTNTPAKFYAVWNEENLDKEELQSLMTKKIDLKTYSKILKDLNGHTFGHKQECNKREISAQDIGIFSLLKQERLLDIVQNFILYDGASKKIARHQQIRAISKARNKIQKINNNKREGGLIWHTQGSGKSLTMVLLAKAIFSDSTIKNPRVIIVSDRKQLDRQISGVFNSCKLKTPVVTASSGSDLISQVKVVNQVTTTLVHKFDSAFKSGNKYCDENSNIFILIDEAHRTQNGDANAHMQKMLPNACIIAFTGTPLMRGEKRSSAKYGGYIDKYTIDEAVEDGNVLPLIYERRFAEITQLKELVEKKIDNDKEINALSDENKKTLQRELTVRTILEIENVVQAISLDIKGHFMKNAYLSNGSPNGFKAQIATASKYSALLFHKYFSQRTDIETAVVISGEVIRDENDSKQKKEIKEFIDSINASHGSLDTYETAVIESYNDYDDGIQILIVVDKLLTGFDAPRDTFLYLIKPLKDHNLLQAIARVNRLCEDTHEKKTAGYVIDYSYNTENIKNAMQLFSKFENEDVQHALIDIDDKIKELDNVYTDIFNSFSGIENTSDDEAYLHALEDEDIRKLFYKRVNLFVKLFAECKVLKDFDLKMEENKQALYKNQMKKLLSIKKAANNKYADNIDLAYFKEKIFKILDVALDVNEDIHQLVEPIDIFSLSSIDKNTSTLSAKSAAETIASQTKRELIIQMDKDPIFYRSFYERIEELLKRIKEGKFEEEPTEWVDEAKQIAQEAFTSKEVENIPLSLKENKLAQIFFRNLQSYFENTPYANDNCAEIVKQIAEYFVSILIVDWSRNKEMQREIKNLLDDYLYAELIQAKELNLLSQLDEIVNTILALGLNNLEIHNVK